MSAEQYNSSAPRRLTISFGEREIPSVHADESVFSVIECPNCGPAHGHIIVAIMTDAPSNSRGRFIALTAEQARGWATALLDLADEMAPATRQ